MTIDECFDLTNYKVIKTLTIRTFKCILINIYVPLTKLKTLNIKMASIYLFIMLGTL